MGHRSVFSVEVGFLVGKTQKRNKIRWLAAHRGTAKAVELPEQIGNNARPGALIKSAGTESNQASKFRDKILK
jgi:hypothetical protein